MPIKTAYDFGVLTSSAARSGKATASTRQVPSTAFHKALVMKIDPFDWMGGIRRVPLRYDYYFAMALPSQCRFTTQTKLNARSWENTLRYKLCVISDNTPAL